MKKFSRIQSITIMGIMTALSIVLAIFVNFPLLPATPFLRYDPADVPILIATFLLGPWAGVVMTLLVAVLQGLLVSSDGGPIGMAMHFLASGTFAFVAGMIYFRHKSRKAALRGLFFGSVAMLIIMVILNILVTPYFLNVPVEAVYQLLVPAIIPFNILKAGINSVLTWLIYKPISRFTHNM